MKKLCGKSSIMKLTRVFLALVLMISTVTPSLAAICASSCAMGCEDMKVTVDIDSDNQQPSAPTGPCHSGDTTIPQDHQDHESRADACPMAAVCTLASSCPLTPMSSAVPYAAASSYFPAVNLSHISIHLPLPIEPPIV